MMSRRLAQIESPPRQWALITEHNDCQHTYFGHCPRCGHDVEAFCSGLLSAGDPLRCPSCNLAGNLSQELDAEWPGGSGAYGHGKEWREWPRGNEICPRCQGTLSVYTEAQVGYVYEGDVVRCLNRATCGDTGHVSVEHVISNCMAYVDWSLT